MGEVLKWLIYTPSSSSSVGSERPGREIRARHLRLHVPSPPHDVLCLDKTHVVELQQASST
jgi:hypothetical protein